MLNIKKQDHFTGHQGAIYALAPESDHTFFSAGGDGWIVRWDLNNPNAGQVVAQVNVAVVAIKYLTAQKIIVAGDLNGGIHWLFLDHAQEHRHVSHHKKGLFGFLQKEEKLFSVGGDGILSIWHIGTQELIESVKISHQALRSIEWHQPTGHILIGSSDHNVYLFDPINGQIVKTILAHENSVFSIKQHPYLSFFLTGSRDARLKAWNAKTMKLLEEQPAHYFTINDIIFIQSGKYAVTASRDKTIKIWDAHTRRLLKVLETIRDGGHINSVNCLAYLPNSSVLLSAGDDRSIIIWEIDNLEQ